MLNLDNKKFIAVENTANGEVSSQTEFHYHQQGKMIWAEYGGGRCCTTFSLEENKLIGHEKWQWLDTLEQGSSLIREI